MSDDKPKTHLYVKPKKGCVVRNPKGMQRLPPFGAKVPNDSFWTRRIAQGDVVETTEDEMKKARKAAQEAKVASLEGKKSAKPEASKKTSKPSTSTKKEG